MNYALTGAFRDTRQSVAYMTLVVLLVAGTLILWWRYQSTAAEATGAPREALVAEESAGQSGGMNLPVKSLASKPAMGCRSSSDCPPGTACDPNTGACVPTGPKSAQGRAAAPGMDGNSGKKGVVW